MIKIAIIIFTVKHQSYANNCINQPCLNGGECLSIQDGYSCNCTVFYTGRRCQIRTSYCDPSHCLNGGSCYHARTIEFREPSCYCKCIKFKFKWSYANRFYNFITFISIYKLDSLVINAKT